MVWRYQIVYFSLFIFAGHFVWYNWNIVESGIKYHKKQNQIISYLLKKKHSQNERTENAYIYCASYLLIHAN